MPVSGVQVTVPETREYELLPKDVYQVELLDIENKTEPGYQTSELEDKLVFVFAVIEDGENYGRRQWKNCTTKLSKFKGGSNLYKTLVGLNGGKEFTDAQVASPETIASDDVLNALIGKQVRLSIGIVEKQTKKGEFKNVIESFLPIKSKLPAYVSREEGEEAPVAKVKTATEAVAEISFDE